MMKKVIRTKKGKGKDKGKIKKENWFESDEKRSYGVHNGKTQWGFNGNDLIDKIRADLKKPIDADPVFNISVSLSDDIVRIKGDFTPEELKQIEKMIPVLNKDPLVPVEEKII